MFLSISFAELHKYISEHFHKDLSFAHVAEKEFTVTFTQRVFIKDVHISVNIHIDEVKPAEVVITYKGGFAIDMIISGALSFLKEKIAELAQGIQPEENHRIRINLSKIEKTKAIVEKLSLKDLKVESDFLRLEANLK